MNKWTGRTGAKVAAWIGITVSAVLFFVGVAGVLVIDEIGVYDYPSEEACRESLYETAADQYTMQALYNIVYGGENDFGDTFFRYGIVRTDDPDSVDLSDKNSYLESNFSPDMHGSRQRRLWLQKKCWGFMKLSITAWTAFFIIVRARAITR